MEFVDVNCSVGRHARGLPRPVLSRAELISAMDDAGIAKAITWHVAQRDASPQDGNGLVDAFIDGSDRVSGCWTILPPQTDEVIESVAGRGLRRYDRFFKTMRRGGIVALRAFPDVHRYVLDRVVFGDFLDAVSWHKVPLLLQPGNGISWHGIYALLKEYPRLTCVVCNIGVWGADRYTWPLLEAFPNVLIESSMLGLEGGGIAASVRRFGAARFVFGSGFPEMYLEASVMALRHADIKAKEKERIASGNARRLLSWE